jgi:hypothetical protein
MRRDRCVNIYACLTNNFYECANKASKLPLIVLFYGSVYTILFVHLQLIGPVQRYFFKTFGVDLGTTKERIDCVL